MSYRIALATIVRKDLTRIFRTWVQTLLPSVVSVTLYFIIFGHMVGKRIGEIAGFSYMQYIAPGLIMMALINNSYANSSFSFFINKFQGSIQELLIAPIPNSIIILGYMLGGMIRGLLVAILVAAIAWIFVDFHIAHFTMLILIMLFAAALFSLAGLINAIFADSFDDIAVIPTFVLTPLTYLSGVFYAVKWLPSFWYHVSLVNPVLYLVEGLRYGMLGVSDISLIWALPIAMIFLLSLFSLALYLLNYSSKMRK